MHFRHSILWRILVYYTGLISLAVTALIAFFYFQQVYQRKRLLELELQRAIVVSIPRFFPPGSGPNRPPRRQGDIDFRPRGTRPQGDFELSNESSPPSPPSSDSESNDRFRNGPGGRAFYDLAANHIFVLAYDSEGESLGKTDNTPVDFDVAPQPDRIPPESRWTFSEDKDNYFLRHFVQSRGQLIIGKPKHDVMSDITTGLSWAIATGLGVILLTSGFGYFIIRNSLRPIRKIGETAERISQGNIHDRIDTGNIQSELGQLATVLNTTFQQLSETLQRQIQFTSDASHELRTPVAAILADCQFALRRERSAERYRETIEVCHESAQHMRKLIEDLRLLASFDEQSDEQIRELTDLDIWLASIANVIAPIAQQKGIQLKRDLHPVTVHIDPDRMRQAALNLLNNAVHYTEAGGSIFISCGQTEDRAYLEIRDTGCGIPPDKLTKIFDRFYRADEARNMHTGGAGLGLSISQTIVESHDGKISVTSEVGHGTCFRIELPKANLGPVTA